MLNSFIMNGLDMFNIIYFWSVLSDQNKDRLKLLSSVIITSALTTIIEQLGLSFVVTYIMIIMTIKIIYKIELRDAVLGFFLILLLDMSLQLVVFLIVDKLIDNNILVKIITEIIILISILIFSKADLSKNVALNNIVSRNFALNNIDSNILIYFVLTCSVYASVFKIIWDYDSGIILNNLFTTSAILSILVVSQILTYLYVVKLTKEKVKLKVSNEYNAVINEIVQEIKQRQHDFINFKNTIKGIVSVVDEKDVKEAINSYMQDEDVNDDKVNSIIYIDNIVIRSIIYRNICKFKKYNINFEYEIENNVLDDILNYNEMSNVLNNLLNNAFEEVIKEECLKKNIKVKIFNENKIAHLVIKNQVAELSNINLNEMFSRGYSTKEEGTRGYGLHNVQTIINAHKGCIKVNVESGEITFDIYFNN